MEPFVHLRELNVVICKVCKFACVADEVGSHLCMRHRAIGLESRHTIEQDVGQIPGIVWSQAELSGFQLPGPDARAI
jgi:hypothetical protein